MDGNIGYKFKDAHIRLGSKIHLNDFYYAEKIFQNSYYAYRYAYLIAEDIRKKLSNNVASYTILGYGVYSVPLVSFIANLLNEDKEGRFNHAIVKDEEGLEIWNEEALEGERDIFLIIPIGSTLSTSLKIKKLPLLKDKIKGVITIIVIGNKEKDAGVSSFEPYTNHITADFLEKIDWETKKIALRDGEQEEKFYLYMKGGWEQPHVCQKCFPDKNIYNEEALFETNKVSVVPQTIFGFPQHKNKKDYRNPFELGLDAWKGVVKRDHYERGSNHFDFYLDTYMFYKNNCDEVKKWLSKLEIQKSQAVYLIAPSHLTNINFVELVNRMVFKNTATIIFCDPSEDDSANFKKFFSFLEKPKEEIFFVFVDDILSTGSTLTTINSYLQQAFDRSISKVFTLIDRRTYFQHELLLEMKANILSFVDIELPVTRITPDPCFLCKEQERYERLLKTIMIDSLKKKIWDERERLKIKKEPQLEKGKKLLEVNNCLPDKEKEKILVLEMLMLHIIYKEFSLWKEKFGKEDITVIKDILNKVKEIPIIKSSYIVDSMIKITLLKLLSLPYFVCYKNIRKTVVKIILLEIRSYLEEKVTDIDYFLELLNLSTRLNMNIILRSEFWEKILLNFSDLQINEELKKKEINIAIAPAIKSIVDFNIAYDDSKSFRFEYELEHWELKDACPQFFKDIYNLIKIENNGVLLKAIELMVRNIENTCKNKNGCILKKNIGLKFTIEEIDNDIERLAKLIKIISINSNNLSNVDIDFNDYRFTYLRYWIELKNSSKNSMIPIGQCKIEEKSLAQVKNNTPLYCFFLQLLLKLYLTYEKCDKHDGGAGEIEKKIKYILSLFLKIAGINEDEGGVFLAINKDYNKYKDGDEALDKSLYDLVVVKQLGIGPDFDMVKDKTSWTQKAFKGLKTGSIPWTNLERYKGDRNVRNFEPWEEWESLAEVRSNDSIKQMLSLRISQLKEETGTIIPQGVLTFYTTKERNSFVIGNPEIVRNLLLLKNEFSEFLHQHYENDSFGEWWINKEQKESYERHIEGFTHGTKEYYQKITTDLATIKNHDDMHKRLYLQSLLSFSKLFLGHYFSLALQEESKLKESVTKSNPPDLVKVISKELSLWEEALTKFHFDMHPSSKKIILDYEEIKNATVSIRFPIKEEVIEHLLREIIINMLKTEKKENATLIINLKESNDDFYIIQFNSCNVVVDEKLLSNLRKFNESKEITIKEMVTSRATGGLGIGTFIMKKIFTLYGGNVLYDYDGENQKFITKWVIPRQYRPEGDE